MYDANNNVIRIDEQLPSPMGWMDHLQYFYSYNSNNQLVSKQIVDLGVPLTLDIDSTFYENNKFARFLSYSLDSLDVMVLKFSKNYDRGNSSIDELKAIYHYDTIFGNYRIVYYCKNNTTNTNNVRQEPTFKVYPNPLSIDGLLHIETSTNQDIQLYDILGKKLWGQTLNKSNHAIQLPNINAGMYFLKTDQGTTKLIVQ